MKVTKAQKKATAKYEKENYYKILVRLPKEYKDKIDSLNLDSKNAFFVDAIRKAIEQAEPKPQELTEKEIEELFS